MIKVEALKGTGTITRNDEPCELFVGMVLNEDEVNTIVTTDELVYSVDELTLHTVTAETSKPAPKTPVAKTPEAPAA